MEITWVGYSGWMTTIQWRYKTMTVIDAWTYSWTYWLSIEEFDAVQDYLKEGKWK